MVGVQDDVDIADEVATMPREPGRVSPPNGLLLGALGFPSRYAIFFYKLPLV